MTAAVRVELPDTPPPLPTPRAARALLRILAAAAREVPDRERAA
jgi:hypothetical protein